MSKEKNIPTDEEFQKSYNLRQGMQIKYIEYMAKSTYATIPIMLLLTHNFWYWLILVPFFAVHTFVLILFFMPGKGKLWGYDLYKITLSTKYICHNNGKQSWLPQEFNVEATYKDECLRTATIVLRYAIYWTLIIGPCAYFGAHPIPFFLGG